MCKILRSLAVERALTVDVEYHTVIPKVTPVEESRKQ